MCLSSHLKCLLETLLCTERKTAKRFVERRLQAAVVELLELVERCTVAQEDEKSRVQRTLTTLCRIKRDHAPSSHHMLKMSTIGRNARWHLLTFSPNSWEFLVQILRAYYTFLSTLDYNFFYSVTSNCDEVMRPSSVRFGRWWTFCAIKDQVIQASAAVT